MDKANGTYYCPYCKKFLDGSRLQKDPNCSKGGRGGWFCDNPNSPHPVQLVSRLPAKALIGRHVFFSKSEVNAHSRSILTGKKKRRVIWLRGMIKEVRDDGLVLIFEGNELVPEGDKPKIDGQQELVTQVAMVGNQEWLIEGFNGSFNKRLGVWEDAPNA